MLTYLFECFIIGLLINIVWKLFTGRYIWDFKS